MRMARYVLEQKKQALTEVPPAQVHSLPLKTAFEAAVERERLRQELWQAYGGELSHFFMVRKDVEE